MRSKRRHFILLTSHCPDLGRSSGSDWKKQLFLVAQPIRGTIQTWIVTHNQCGIWIFSLPWTLFCRKESGGVTKWWLFYQATFLSSNNNIIKLWLDWRQINFTWWDKYIWGRISFSLEKSGLNATEIFKLVGLLLCCFV